MPQIFDVTANEYARHKCNELEYTFPICRMLCMLTVYRFHIPNLTCSFVCCHEFEILFNM